MVAAGTPPGVIDKISRDTTRVAQDDLRQRFVDIGAVAIGNLLGSFLQLSKCRDRYGGDPFRWERWKNLRRSPNRVDF
jgi:hypothetical protein